MQFSFYFRAQLPSLVLLWSGWEITSILSAQHQRLVNYKSNIAYSYCCTSCVLQCPHLHQVLVSYVPEHPLEISPPWCSSSSRGFHVHDFFHALRAWVTFVVIMDTLLKSALLCIVLWSYIASMPAVFASLDQWLNWPYPWAKHIIIWGASFGILVMCAMNFVCCFLANTPIQVVLAICRMSSLNFQAQFWLTHTWFLFLMYLSILWNYHHLGGGLEPMPDFPGLWKIQKVTCINMLCSTPFSKTNLYPLP